MRRRGLRRRLLDSLERWLLRIWYGGASPADRLLALPLAPFGLAASTLVATLARHRRARLRRQPPGQQPPVVIVGNLVAGGAGKTPAVIALARGMTARGHRVGLLARGYRSPDAPAAATVQLLRPDGAMPENGPPGNGSSGSGWPDAAVVGDEPLVLARATGLAVAVGADRAAALALLLKEVPDLTMVISDDGLQHTGLARAVELVIVDERGFGNGWCLPAGPLREPVDRLALVDAVLLHRRDRLPDGVPPPPACHQLRTAIGSFATVDGKQRWTPEEFRAHLAATEPPERPLPALAAIARPERFFNDLRALGLAIEPLPLPDHASIDPALLARLAGRTVVMTAKDAVKLGKDRPECSPRIIVAEQVGQVDDSLLNWLATTWPAPGH